MVIGFGGGSVLDTAKAVAALLSNGGEPLDYLEHIGRGKRLEKRSAPMIAIPTTAGTGSEVTRNAVIYSPGEKVKVSLRSPKIQPQLAVVDPELTYSMPAEQTATSGMDSLTQLLEPYVTRETNPLVDAVCRIGMERAARSIRRAYNDGNNREARRDMALASLFSGVALANAKLGAVHGLSGALGGVLRAPHGMLCARLLPLIMKANIEALQARDPDSPVLTRYDEVAVLLTGSRVATGIDGVCWVRALCADLKIKPLSDYGLETKLFPAIIQRSRGSSSMQGNPIALTDDELTDVLRKAM
jgi:alcohol dehydrogenase class IV